VLVPQLRQAKRILAVVRAEQRVAMAAAAVVEGAANIALALRIPDRMERSREAVEVGVVPAGVHRAELEAMASLLFTGNSDCTS